MCVRRLLVKTNKEGAFKSNFISVATITLNPLILLRISTGTLWINIFLNSEIALIDYSITDFTNLANQTGSILPLDLGNLVSTILTGANDE